MHQTPKSLSDSRDHLFFHVQFSFPSSKQWLRKGKLRQEGNFRPSIFKSGCQRLQKIPTNKRIESFSPQGAGKASLGKVEITAEGQQATGWVESSRPLTVAGLPLLSTYQ